MHIRPLSRLLPMLALLAGLVPTRPISAAPSAGPCNVSGTISQDTTWDPATCYPYIVTGDITVDLGVTLTVDPGTRVEMGSRTALYAHGPLLAQGTAQKPVVFTANSPTPAPGYWDYLILGRDSLLSYTIVEYGGANYGFNDEQGMVILYDSRVTVANSVIHHSKYNGIYIYPTAGQVISGNTIEDNDQNGIRYFLGIGGAQISDNLIQNNVQSGIYLEDGYGLSPADMRRAALNSRNRDQEAATAHGPQAGQVIVSGNLIRGNHGYLYGGGINLFLLYTSPVIEDNHIFGNSASTGGGISILDGGMVRNNYVSGNHAGAGGGIAIYAGDGATVTGNTITDNNAGDGGGVYCQDCYPTGSIQSNLISGNSATRGGGIFLDYELTSTNNSITDNIITNNTAYQAPKGGGIYVCSACRPILSHNSIYGNWLGQPGGPDRNDLYNGLTAGAAPLVAENNYWGSTVLETVASRIWDHADDPSLGVVDFVPYLTRSAGNVLVAPGFEGGPYIGWRWSAADGHTIINQERPQSGAYSADLCGYDNCRDAIRQALLVPDGAQLSYSVYIVSAEGRDTANDVLNVVFTDLNGHPVKVLRTVSNRQPHDTWLHDTLDVSAFAGQALQLRFVAAGNASLPTEFYVDDVGVQ